jgi:hypothetical protein
MRNLLKYASSATRQILHHRRCSSGPRVSFYARPFYSSGPRVAFNVRPFCSSKGGDSSNGDNNGDGETSSELAEVEEDLKKLSSALVEDVETVGKFKGYKGFIYLCILEFDQKFNRMFVQGCWLLRFCFCC